MVVHLFNILVKFGSGSLKCQIRESTEVPTFLSISNLMFNSGIPFTHISSPMPEMYRSVNVIPRGVANRRAALDWIRLHVKSGVLYFGDDDNTFDLRLFEEIRFTKRVSMFPVGLIGEYGVSAPIVKEVCYKFFSSRIHIEDKITLIQTYTIQISEKTNKLNINLKISKPAILFLYEMK